MTSSNHPSDEVLADYAQDRESVHDEALREHISQCEQCSARVREFEAQFVAFETALKDPDTWWAVDELGEIEAKRQRLVSFRKRLAREDVRAEVLIGRFLDSQYRFTYANIIGKRRNRTGGVVRLLTSKARELADRDPRFAIALAESACAIAEALPDDYYPADAVNELRGTAWKEYAVACRYRGLLPEGLAALDRAERAYRRLLESTLQLATVDSVRALILWEQGDYTNALRYCRAALNIFRIRREWGKYAQTKEIEAHILHRQGQVQLARDAYRDVYDSADASGDDEQKARASRNLAVALTDLGETAEARHFLGIALEIFVKLENPAMVVHTRWAIAWVALLSGDAKSAVQDLPEIVSELTERGMAADAARAQLDLAEALFVLGRFDEVALACGSLGAFFRRANMLPGALTAAAFMREAANARVIEARGRLKADAARPRPLTRHDFAVIRDYLRDLRLSPDRPFEPPKE